VPAHEILVLAEEQLGLNNRHKYKIFIKSSTHRLISQLLATRPLLKQMIEAVLGLGYHFGFFLYCWGTLFHVYSFNVG
jgi:hypothetical protein